jgi:predicted Zn-dependent protease
MSWLYDRKYPFALVGVLLLVLAFTACSDGEDGGDAAVTTTAPEQEGSAPVTTRSAVVGGKTAEEYEQSIGDIENQLSSSPKDVELLTELAVAQYQTGRYEEAAETYEKMLGIDDQPIRRNNYANVLRDANLKEEAEEQYEKALEVDPALTVAYINLASMLFYDDKKQEALAVLDTGIENTTGEDQERLKTIKKGFSEE